MRPSPSTGLEPQIYAAGDGDSDRQNEAKPEYGIRTARFYRVEVGEDRVRMRPSPSTGLEQDHNGDQGIGCHRRQNEAKPEYGIRTS